MRLGTKVGFRRFNHYRSTAGIDLVTAKFGKVLQHGAVYEAGPPGPVV